MRITFTRPSGSKVTAFIFYGKKDRNKNEGRGTKQRTVVNKERERERLNSVLRENHLKKQNGKKCSSIKHLKNIVNTESVNSKNCKVIIIYDQYVIILALCYVCILRGTGRDYLKYFLLFC